jgi:LmbE family N-acetylglucosaminyl deacetylase
MFNDSRILIFVAHPDDEVLGMGGSIYRLSKELNCKVKVVYLNDGFKDRKSVSDVGVHSHIDRVSKILGFEYVLYNYAASYMDTVPSRELADVMHKEFTDFKPDYVFTHAADDLHQDHLKVLQACAVCCRMKQGSTVKGMFTFHTISSSDISPITKTGHYSMFIELQKEHLLAKVNAMKQYENELYAAPKERGYEAIKIWANFVGLNSGYSLAEGFVTQYVRN